MTEMEVYNLLKNDATLTTLVNGRIYPMVAPQNVAKPYITYMVVSGLRLQCLGGEIYQGSYRMQMDCFSTTYGNAKAISEAVKNCLVGFMDSNNIDIRDGYDNETQLFRQLIDFNIKN